MSGDEHNFLLRMVLAKEIPEGIYQQSRMMKASSDKILSLVMGGCICMLAAVL